jgi:hypothetical protein
MDGPVTNDSQEENVSERDATLDFINFAIPMALSDQIGSENFEFVESARLVEGEEQQGRIVYDSFVDSWPSYEDTIHELKEFLRFRVDNVVITHGNKEYKFGDFNVTITLNRRIICNTSPTYGLSVTLGGISHYMGYTINVSRVGDGDNYAVHPHVSNGGVLCMGSHRESARSHLEQGNYLYVCLLVDQILRNYSAESPHYQIENFESGSEECQVCGMYKVDYSKVKRNIVCNDCVSAYCTDDFGLQDMPEKMEFCSCCGSKSSQGKFTNSKCDTFFCKTCQESGNTGIGYRIPNEPQLVELQEQSGEQSVFDEPVPF